MRVPRFEDHPVTIERLVGDTVAGCDPGALLVRHWRDHEVTGAGMGMGADSRDPVVLALGKASVSMARALVGELGITPREGLIVGPEPVVESARGDPRLSRFVLMAGDHPLPTARSEAAGRAALQLVRPLGERDEVIALVSGGASAQMCAPRAGVSLDDVRAVTDALLRAGAPIEDLNTVRACVDAVKAGGLARAAAPAVVRTLVLRDVVVGGLSVVSSGPTIPTATSPRRALEALERWGARDAAPALAAFLEAQPETEDEAEDLVGVNASEVGSNRSAVEAAVKSLRRMNLHVGMVRTDVVGEAGAVGRQLAAVALQAAARVDENPGRPEAIVWGGEPTVGLPADRESRGHGGRAQHAALAAALAIDGALESWRGPGRPRIAVSAFGVDGVDGIVPEGESAPMGAMVSTATAKRAREKGVDPLDALARCDSFGFFRGVGGALPGAPTGTNLNDVMVALVYPQPD